MNSLSSSRLLLSICLFPSYCCRFSVRTLTSFSAPTRREGHFLRSPVSVNPHFTITRPEAGLSVKCSPKRIVMVPSFRQCPMTIDRASVQSPGFPVWSGNPVAHFRLVIFQRQVGRFGQVVSCTSNDCTGFLQNNCPGGLIGKVFPDSIKAFFFTLMR